MEKKTAKESLMGIYRVLDLTDEKGLSCGMLLAGLGADVIKVEKPGGDSARNIGPFYGDIPHAERSLFWFANNLNKRSITLNLQSLEGRQIFQRLVKTADFVIESFPPGYMSEIGCDYQGLNQINSRLIMTSITPFGQTGPYKDYKASDLICVASGGLLYLNGDPDRPPVRITFPQAYAHAGVHAAVASMIAHYHREIKGKGQYIDVSIQESMVWPAVVESLFWEYERFMARRIGPKSRRGYVSVHEVWPCKDGHVSLRIMVGTYGRAMEALTGWMDEEGMAGPLKGKDWQAIDMAQMTQEEVDQWEEVIRAFFAKKTKAELFKEALERGFSLMPSYTPKDIAEDEQLQARDFWAEMEHAELGTVTYLGEPFKLSVSPGWGRRCAPLIGEHNLEIYEEELGFSREQLITLKTNNVI